MHRSVMPFQAVGNMVTLDVPHAVLVEEEARGIMGTNTIPHHRLYAVKGVAGDDGGAITNGEDGRHYALVPNGVYFMPAQVPLQFQFEPGLRMAAFHFTLTLSVGMDLFHGQRRYAVHHGCGALVDAIWEAMHDVDHPGALVRGRGLLMEMAALFMDKSAADIHALAALRLRYQPIFDRLEQSCTARLRVGDMAAEMQMSAAALSRNFHRDFGITLKAFLSQTVMRKAAEALLSPRRSIKNIAYDLEFPNEFYFSRVFKKHTGTSPREYRRIHREPTEGMGSAMPAGGGLLPMGCAALL